MMSIVGLALNKIFDITTPTAQEIWQKRGGSIRKTEARVGKCHQYSQKSMTVNWTQASQIYPISNYSWKREGLSGSHLLSKNYWLLTDSKSHSLLMSPHC